MKCQLYSKQKKSFSLSPSEIRSISIIHGTIKMLLCYMNKIFFNINSLSRLSLDMNHPSSLDFLKDVYKVDIIPVIKTIELFGVKKEDYNLRYFLRLLDFANILAFALEGDAKECLLGEEIVNFYLSNREYTFLNKDVKFSKCYFSNSSFESLIQSHPKIKNLWLEKCRLDFESEIDFRDYEPNLNKLVLTSCYEKDANSMSVTFIQNIASSIYKCPDLK